MQEENRNFLEGEFIWDLESAPINFPQFIRKKFEFNYCKNRIKYNRWIDGCGKSKNSNIDWWMTLPSYRNPYINNIFNYLAALDTLSSLKNKKTNLQIITSSKQLSILINRHFKNSFKVKLKKKNNKITSINNFLKSIIFQLITFFFINIFIKKNFYDGKKIVVVDQFVTLDERQNSNFYKKFSNTKNLKTLIAPSLMPTMNFIKLFKNLFKLTTRDNLIFKEHYLKLNDLIFSFGHIFRRRNLFKSEARYKNFNLSKLLEEETFRYNDFFSINTGILNYIFFKRSASNKLNFVKSINWFEFIIFLQEVDIFFLRLENTSFVNS